MGTAERIRGVQQIRLSDAAITLLLTALLLTALASPLCAREKDALRYGEGLIVNIPFPVEEVTRAVEEVAGNGIIRGTKEYNKDEYVGHAEAASSTSVFPAWTDSGKVSYKVRKEALSPWNFRDSNDAGTLAVRYVVQPQGDKNTVLRIDAVFVEDFRHTMHVSNGSVETSEYKDIQDHLGAMELLKKEAADAEQKKQEQRAKKDFGFANDTDLLSTPTSLSVESSSKQGPLATGVSSPLPSPPVDASAYATPEEHLADLRRQVERVVRKPGAPLKSAPFHTASTLKSLSPGTEVLIVILTPYWFGVETHDGQHGWIQRDQLEAVP